LQYGLAIVLAFIGVKMLSEAPIEHYFHVNDRAITYASLGVVGSTLLGSILLSLVIPLRNRRLVFGDEDQE
jgi:predicted tellurium resistance membrane protein TerC